MWKKLSEILAAIGGAIASFFTGMPPLVWILVAVMTMDFITGLICAAMGKSKKTSIYNGKKETPDQCRELLLGDLSFRL